MIKSTIRVRRKSDNKIMEVYPHWYEICSDLPFSEDELEFDIDRDSAYISISDLRRLLIEFITEGIVDIKHLGLDQMINKIMDEIKK